MVGIHPCGFCKNYKGLKDGWDIVCNAYPQGGMGWRSAEECLYAKDCGNGYRFVPNENPLTPRDWIEECYENTHKEKRHNYK